MDKTIEQRAMADMLKEVKLSKVDASFALRLSNRAQSEEGISDREDAHLRHFVYRYREQIGDNIIYEGYRTEAIEELLGDDPRESLKEFIENCEQYHKGWSTKKNDAD